jgi:hypothetical protein
MDEYHLVRGMLLRAGRGQPATAPIAKAIVEWAQPHVDWLVGHPPVGDAELGWADLLRGIVAEQRRDAARHDPGEAGQPDQRDEEKETVRASRHDGD